MTRSQTPQGAGPACADFEERLSAWLEGELDDRERATLERHRAGCASCGRLLADLDAIVIEAEALRPMTPSRDLWSGIEARLEAPVIPLSARRDDLQTVRAPLAPRALNGMSVRRFAVAATLLVAVSSGVTWQLATGSMASTSAGAVAGTSSVPASARESALPGNVPSGAPAAPAASPATPIVAADSASVSPTPVAVAATSASGARERAAEARPVSNVAENDLDAVYEREIAALRRIVDRRFAELDTATVNALRRNLEIIDSAIADSRRALEKDPGSGLLSTQLDRTLEAKLSLMRRVALL